MPNLSYQEQSLYGSLAAELLVYGSYFTLHRDNSVDKVAAMIAAVIALQIVLQSLIAAFTRNRIKDERDQMIQLRGYRAGYITLAGLMVFGLGMLWLHTTTNTMHIDARDLALHFLSVFFGMLVLADIVKTVAQIIAYRRSI